RPQPRRRPPVPGRPAASAEEAAAADHGVAVQLAQAACLQFRSIMASPARVTVPSARVTASLTLASPSVIDTTVPVQVGWPCTGVIAIHGPASGSRTTMVELASATGSPSLVMSVVLTSSTIAPPDLTVTPVRRERRVRVSPAYASAW